MSIDTTLLNQLMKNRSPGDLFGKDGILSELTKALVERALTTEPGEHIGEETITPVGTFVGRSSPLHGARCTAPAARRPRGDDHRPLRNAARRAELIGQRGPWRRFEDVELATLEWMDWFNNRRLLGSIGNIPPAEADFYARLAEIKIAA